MARCTVRSKSNGEVKGWHDGRKTIELKEREENRTAAAEAKRAVQKANEARAEEEET